MFLDRRSRVTQFRALTGAGNDYPAGRNGRITVQIVTGCCMSLAFSKGRNKVSSKFLGAG